VARVAGDHGRQDADNDGHHHDDRSGERDLPPREASIAHPGKSPEGVWSFTVINDELVDALLAILLNGGESEELRGKAAIP
jgi:hypothetical protein